jgi:uncharacterized membrane protein
MAESRHRHKHAQHHASHPQNVRHEPKTSVRKAGLILAIFLGLIGLASAFFAVGTTTAMIIGGIIGMMAGFLIGISLDRAAERKKK